jgi:hypothetical protein
MIGLLLLTGFAVVGSLLVFCLHGRMNERAARREWKDLRGVGRLAQTRGRERTEAGGRAPSRVGFNLTLRSLAASTRSVARPSYVFPNNPRESQLASLALQRP